MAGKEKGFVEADDADGLLEIFGLKQRWHASFVIVELIYAKHIAQAAALRSEFGGGGLGKLVSTNGWRTMETAIEQGFLNVHRNKEGVIPVTHD